MRDGLSLTEENLCVSVRGGVCLEEGLKEDTVHIICGSTNKTYFWANINEIEIS